MGFGDSRRAKLAIDAIIEIPAQCPNAPARLVPCLDESDAPAGFAQLTCRDETRKSCAYDENCFAPSGRGPRGGRTDRQTGYGRRGSHEKFASRLAASVAPRFRHVPGPADSIV